MIYDVAVIGAGPSGAFLGYLMAKAGRSVIIMDKQAFPRAKVCGGGISHKTVELLASEFDIGEVIQQRISGAFLAFRNTNIVEKILHDRGGASVLRSEFDDLILRHAVGRGATFVPHSTFVSAMQHGDVVTTETSTGSVRARFLIGADGVFSSVRRNVFGSGLVTYAPAVEALVRVSETVLRRFNGRVLFDFGGMKNGYGWIFPKKDHLNVGVFSIFPHTGASIRGALGRFMELYESLKHPAGVEFEGSCIPVRNTKHIYQQDRIWLVGDAAGFAESVYGEGIYFALKSAAVAADALSATSTKARDSSYHRALAKSEMLSDMRYSELNARLVFRFPRFSFDHLVRNASVNDLFAELIAGGIGHKACFVRTLFTSPYWSLTRLPVSEAIQGRF